MKLSITPETKNILACMTIKDIQGDTNDIHLQDLIIDGWSPNKENVKHDIQPY